MYKGHGICWSMRKIIIVWSYNQIANLLMKMNLVEALTEMDHVRFSSIHPADFFVWFWIYAVQDTIHFASLHRCSIRKIKKPGDAILLLSIPNEPQMARFTAKFCPLLIYFYDTNASNTRWERKRARVREGSECGRIRMTNFTMGQCQKCHWVIYIFIICTDLFWFGDCGDCGDNDDRQQWVVGKQNVGEKKKNCYEYILVFVSFCCSFFASYSSLYV